MSKSQLYFLHQYLFNNSLFIYKINFFILISLLLFKGINTFNMDISEFFIRNKLFNF